MNLTCKECGWLEQRDRRQAAERARWLFFDRLANAKLDDPVDAYRLICEAWCEVTHARWGWFWMADQLRSPTELQLVSGHAIKPPLPLPEQLAIAKTNSVAAFCIQETRPQFVTDFENWRGGDESQHRVGLAQFLREQWCASFLCVPLVTDNPPASLDRPTDSGVYGALCLHFDDASDPLLHTPRLLLLMASISCRLIQSAHYAKQRRLIRLLSKVANDNVGVHGVRARQRRKSYAKAVLNVIAQEMQVEGMSLFYNSPMMDCIECIATSGFMNKDGNRIVDETFVVSYNYGEGMTGKCCYSGIPYFSQSHRSAGSEGPRYLEWTEDGGQLPAAALYPIPKGPHPGSDEYGPAAAGVMRLVRHTTPAFGERRIKFDALAVSTLELIASEIGTILNGLTSSIQKENMLSWVEHDTNKALAILAVVNDSIQARAGVAGGSNKPSIAISSWDAEDIESTLRFLRNISCYISIDGTKKPVFELIDVCAAVVALAQLVDRHYPKILGAQFHVKIEPSIVRPKVMVDRTMFDRALLNVLVNAATHGGDGAKIQVRFSFGSGSPNVSIDVSNDGPTIAPDEVEKIFQHGFVGTNGRKAGSGVGLPVARQLLEKNKGRIVVHSEAGLTTFRITLPLASF